jgi:predicted TPR repeat methyltransferase
LSGKKINVNQFDQRLAAAYNRSEDKEQQYDEWAASYDSDLVDDMGYVAFRDAGDIFIDLVPDTSYRVLDVACGTGLAGEYLQARGFDTIDGADFSREMLLRANQREVYRSTWQHDFTTAKILDDPYDALICVGLFSFAVPKIAHMHHVVNCVKRGGLCVITVNGAAWEALGLEAEVQAEAATHQFDIDRVITAGYIQNEGIDSRVLVIRRGLQE